MPVKQTSIDAHREYTQGGVRMQANYDLILNCIGRIEPGLTRQQISDRTKLPINIVTPRVNELLDMDFLKIDGRRKNTYGKYAEVLKVPN